MNPFKKNKKLVSIFTTAGYPSADSLINHLQLFDKKGVDFVEVGIPFSDPLADGPTIQKTSAEALKNGMNIHLIFEQLGQRTSSLPIVLMGYLNPIMKYGVKSFLIKCQELKISSLIIPDMSIEIYKRFYKDLFEEYSISISFLVTPNTDKERILETAKLCENSFVYLVSSNSTTGEKIKIDMTNEYVRVKTLCKEIPVFVGFGIRNKQDIQKIHETTDGAIIGSAFLDAVGKNKEEQFLDSIIY